MHKIKYKSSGHALCLFRPFGGNTKKMIKTLGKVVKQLRLPTDNTEGAKVTVVTVQEGDINSRILEISLYDNNGDIDLSGYTNAILTATSESGESFFASKLCEFLDDGKRVLIEIRGELTEKPGRLNCDIRLSNEDDSIVLTSQTFHVIVLESQVNLFIKDNIENCNDLLTAIKEVEKQKLTEQERVSAENNRVVAENKRIAQEQIRINNNANMVANENIRQENERSRITAESGRVALSERFNKLLQPIDNTMANQVGRAELSIDNSTGKIVAKNLKGEKGDKGEDGTIIKVGNVQKKELGFTSDPQSQLNTNRETLVNHIGNKSNPHGITPEQIGALRKTTFEYSLEHAVSEGDTGKICIAKVPIHDTSITICISHVSLYNETLYGTIVCSAFNGNVQQCNIYNDYSDILRKKLTISRIVENGIPFVCIYGVFPVYSKLYVKLVAVRATSEPKNILTQVNSIPTTNLINIDNAFKVTDIIYDKNDPNKDLGYPNGINKNIAIQIDLNNYKTVRCHIANENHATNTLIEVDLDTAYHGSYTSGGINAESIGNNIYIFMASRVKVSSNKLKLTLDGAYFVLNATSKSLNEVGSQTMWITRIEGVRR